MKSKDHCYAPPRSVTLRDGRAFTIRLIEADDLPQMVAFYRDIPAKDARCYRNTSARMVATAAEWVSGAATNPYTVCLVLVDEAGVVHGEAYYRWSLKNSETSGFGICIRTTVQGQGAGRLLMTRLLEIGDTYGPPKMSLTVQFENIRAWKLYTSLGFEPVFDRMCVVRVDAPSRPEFYMERIMGTAPRKKRKRLRVGWSSVDLTPTHPVFIVDQFHGRLPEEPADPLTVTVLVLENGEGCAAFVLCDLLGVFSGIDSDIRIRLSSTVPELNSGTVILNATHTHTGPSMDESRAFLSPELRERFAPRPPDAAAYRDVVITRIVDAVADAWKRRMPGKVAWGIDFAVVGRNCRRVDHAGQCFSHGESYEDHSVNVLATYDPDGALTGVVVNVPSSSQVNETDCRFFSADYWHDTRLALRKQFGDALYVMPQCSAAGDQAPRPFYDKAALQRMERLRNQTPRSAISARLVRAVGDVVAVIGAEATDDLPLSTASSVINLPLNRINVQDAEAVLHKAEEFEAQRDVKIKKLSDNPDAARTIVVRGLRLGDVAFVTNPFEYYLDYCMIIKARSPFLQTFLIQLAGKGSYVPSLCSTSGDGDGSIPASNPIGPEGGMTLVEATIALLNSLYAGD